MEFDAVLIAPRRAASVAQGLWHDKTINTELDACVAHCPDKLALTAVQAHSGAVERMTYRELAAMADRVAGGPGGGEGVRGRGGRGGAGGGSACPAWACAATTRWPASCPTGGSSLSLIWRGRAFAAALNRRWTTFPGTSRSF